MRALIVLLTLAAGSALACDPGASKPFGINRNAVVEQPAPPAVTAAFAQATLDVGNTDGCGGGGGCADLSHVDFFITTAEAGRFGYQIQFLDRPLDPPLIAGVALEPLEREGDVARVRLAWPSGDQHRSGTLRAQIRTYNLVAEPGPWSDPILVTPAPRDKGSEGAGLGILVVLVLLGVRRFAA